MWRWCRGPARGAGGVRAAYRVERRKLASQLAPRLLALICVLGPFAFAAVLKVQSGSPADTLYGRLGAFVGLRGLARRARVLRDPGGCR